MSQSDRNKQYDKNVFILFSMCSVFFGSIWGAHLWTENQSAKEEAHYERSTLAESREAKEPPTDMDPTEAKREELRILAQSMRVESQRRKEAQAHQAAEDAKRLRDLKRRWNQRVMEDTRPIRKLLGTQNLTDRLYDVVGD
jgi:hypothetical protein